MRTISLGFVALAALGAMFLPTAISAAPVNGASTIASIADSLNTVDTVHCKKTKHRHTNNKPHAYGTGCK